MTALNYFPGLPRPQQAHALLELTREWPHYDTFVIVGPTGLGKMPMAVAIARWVESLEFCASVVVPNVDLLNQYAQSHPNFTVLRGSFDYQCTSVAAKCGKVHTRKKDPGCRKTCPHLLAKSQSATGASVMGIHTYFGTRKGPKGTGYPQVAIFDEAHKIIDFLQGQGGVNLWQPKYKWPNNLHTHEDVVSWILSKKSQDPKLVKAHKLLTTANEHTLVERRWDSYYDRQEEVLRIVPLSVAKTAVRLWPYRRVIKRVFLDATLWEADCRALGLDESRVKFIKCDSPIHHQSRPVIWQPHVSLSHYCQNENIAQMALQIGKIAAHHSREAGIVHITYDTSELYRKHLGSDRYLWHNKYSKAATLDMYIKLAETQLAPVLFACGMHEGIDLYGDRARWQVIPKIPFPNLGDAAVAKKAELDPEWYDVEAIRQLIQMCGRVCRGPDDFGRTYILDPRFPVLFNRREYLFPQWFKDSIRWK